jgi:DNA ligase-1
MLHFYSQQRWVGWSIRVGSLANRAVCSKFFGQANGAKGKGAPPQQTKLSFSTKAGVKAKSEDESALRKRNEEEDVEEEEVEEQEAEKGESDKG